VSAWYYTFGPLHTLPFRTLVAPETAYVIVEVPQGVDPRPIAIAAFRSRAADKEAPASDLFAGEYSPVHDGISTIDSIVMHRKCIGVISMEQTCLVCEWPESDCKCIVEPEDEV
jgi:hypothetical protein